MKKLIFLILLIPGLLFAGPLQKAHMAVIGAGSTDAGGTSTYIGWENTNGVPDSNPTSTASLGAPMVVTRLWTVGAGISGTAESINVYIGYTSGTPNANVCLYRDVTGTKTRIGWGNIGSTGTGWTGNITLTAISGQNLNFSAGDLLYYGVEVEGTDYINAGREDSGGAGMLFNNTASWVSDTNGLGTTVVLSSSSDRDMAFILGYK